MMFSKVYIMTAVFCMSVVTAAPTSEVTGNYTSDILNNTSPAWDIQPRHYSEDLWPYTWFWGPRREGTAWKTNPYVVDLDANGKIISDHYRDDSAMFFEKPHLQNSLRCTGTIMRVLMDFDCGRTCFKLHRAYAVVLNTGSMMYDPNSADLFFDDNCQDPDLHAGTGLRSGRGVYTHKCHEQRPYVTQPWRSARLYHNCSARKFFNKTIS